MSSPLRRILKVPHSRQSVTRFQPLTATSMVYKPGHVGEIADLANIFRDLSGLVPKPFGNSEHP
jgi:hypothetical protein